MSRMRCLSAEVVALILSFLSPEQILTARCVCSLWRALCEQIIVQRDRHNGPFVRLGAKACAPRGTLPVYETSRYGGLTAPSLARAGHGSHRSSLLAPFARAKLTRLCVYERDVWTPSLLNPRSLPRLTHLEFFQNTGERVLHEPWPRVTALTLNNNLFAAAVLDMVPGCQILTLHDCRVGVGGLAGRPLQCLHMTAGALAPEELAGPIAEVRLANVHVLTPVAPATVVAPDAYWPEDPTGGPLPDVRHVLDCPDLEVLDVEFTTKLSLVLRAPRLRRLLQGAGSPRVLKSAIAHLESATLSRIETGDIAWLAGQPLRSLVLKEVRLPNANFLAACVGLETLEISELAMHAQSLPFAALTRLKTLKLGMEHDLITNIEDIGRIAALEVLYLAHVPSVRSLVFVGALGRLRRLRLVGLRALTSLDGVQRAAELTWLTTDDMPWIMDYDALFEMRKIDKLKLRWRDTSAWKLSMRSLDLSRTPCTRLVLQYVDCEQMPRLPRGLHTLEVADCTFGRDPSVSPFLCIAPLKCLRRVHWQDLSAYVPRGVFCEPTALRMLRLCVKGVSRGAFECLRADTVYASFEDPLTEHDALLEVARLAPATLHLLLWHNVDSEVYRRLAPSVRSLGLHLKTGSEYDRIDGVDALTRLERLSLGFRRGGRCLEALRGHASLRELALHGEGPLDIAPLLTCPRLADVALDKHTVSETLLAALRAHIEAQAP